MITCYFSLQFWMISLRYLIFQSAWVYVAIDRGTYLGNFNCGYECYCRWKFSSQALKESDTQVVTIHEKVCFERFTQHCTNSMAELRIEFASSGLPSVGFTISPSFSFLQFPAFFRKPHPNSEAKEATGQMLYRQTFFTEEPILIPKVGPTCALNEADFS